MSAPGRAAPNAGVCFHLTPEEVWRTQEKSETYQPEAFAEDGFIHCTIGADEVLKAGDRYYQADPRSYVVLELDMARITAPVRFDDFTDLYPHVYGSLDRNAISIVRRIERDKEGRFVAIR